jgi:hypothetical protein
MLTLRFFNKHFLQDSVRSFLNSVVRVDVSSFSSLENCLIKERVKAMTKLHLVKLIDKEILENLFTLLVSPIDLEETDN